MGQMGVFSRRPSLACRRAIASSWTLQGTLLQRLVVSVEKDFTPGRKASGWEAEFQ